MMLLCFVLWLNNTSAFVGHFKLSPKEREKLGMEEIVKKKEKERRERWKRGQQWQSRRIKNMPFLSLATSTNDLNTF